MAANKSQGELVRGQHGHGWLTSFVCVQYFDETVRTMYTHPFFGGIM